MSFLVLLYLTIQRGYIEEDGAFFEVRLMSAGLVNSSFLFLERLDRLCMISLELAREKLIEDLSSK